MHSGCTLLARPLEVLICLSVPCTLALLLTGGQQRGIISPFGAMHAGSSLLTGGQQRGIISPFGAMHAGSSLLTGGQQRETLLDQVMKVFGDSTPEDKAQSGLEVCRSTKGIRKIDQKKTEGHGDLACMVCSMAC
ncbi:hypothetical protein Tco_0300063 [Tanacetum coccineum]